MTEAERKLAAILSADVVGYSRLMAEDEAATIHTLTDYREEIAMLVRQHRGRVVDSPGDNLLAEFPTALDAVRSAAEIQRVIGARNADLPSERRMEFRIGVHLGDVAVEGERIYGDGVNIAARLEGLAEPGGICISASVHDQVESKLDLVCEDLGEQEVKNIPRPVRVYRVEIPPEPAPRAPGVEVRSRRLLPIGVGILLVGVIAMVLWWRFSPAPPRAPLPTAIAVLPFADMSPGGDQEYFADGMSEELISRLSKIEDLRVVARTSAFAFKGKQVDIREIGEQLDVGAVVEGSVRKAGDRLRITAQLVQVADGYHLWSETYERQLDDVFAIQDEVARAVAGALEARLDSAQASKPPTADLRAYELYLMGRFFEGPRTKEGNRKAIQYFEQALEVDPEYAPAYSGLADSYMLIALELLDAEGFAKAGEAATRAVAIDDSLAEGHASLGFYRYVMYDWPGAEVELRRALAINPGYAIAHTWYAQLLITTGRVDESLAETRRALQLDPLSSAINAIAGHTYLAAGDHDTAVDRLERALELNPDLSVRYRYVLEYAYHLAGREAEAVEALLDSLDPDVPPEVESSLREASARAGLQGGIRKLLELEVARTGKRCPFVWSFALYAFMEEGESALECLQEGARRGAPFGWAGVSPTSYLKVHPLYDGLRSDPRFTAILKSMGLNG